MKTRKPKLRRLEEYAFITRKKIGKVKTVRKHRGKASLNPLLMTVGNPLYAKVGKYGATATRGFRRLPKARLLASSREDIDRVEKGWREKKASYDYYLPSTVKDMDRATEEYKRGRKSNPLLMTVGNPWKVMTKSGVKTVKTMGDAAKIIMSPQNIRESFEMIPVGKMSKQKMAKEQKEYKRIMGINPCGSKKNPSGSVSVWTDGDTDRFGGFIQPYHVKSKMLPRWVERVMKAPPGLTVGESLAFIKSRGGKYKTWTTLNPCGSKKNPTVKRYRSVEEMDLMRRTTSKAYKDAYKGVFGARYSKGGASKFGSRLIGSKKYAPNEAGIKPLVAGSRTKTMPFEKGAALIYAKESPSRIRCFEAQVKAYQSAHRGDMKVGPLPATLTFKKIKIGSKNVTDRTYTVSMGTIPESTYTVPGRSGKAKQSRHWRHEWKTKRLHQEVFPGGKVIMNDGGGMKLVKQGWMDA